MKNNKQNIILIEDDPTLGYLLTEYLKMNNFEISWAKTGVDCLKMLEMNIYDLAILDVMLPDTNGFDLATKIKNLHPNLPFIFLTARSLKIDVLKGFSAGAIDYLKKPIDEEELVVRIKTLLFRLESPKQKTDNDDTYKLGTYVFNTLKQELIYNDQKTDLTNRETQLLLYLVNHKNNLCTHKDILTTLWGENDYFNKKSLNVFITHLRKYLKNDSSLKIENIHNRGFILRIDD
ncbi:DNA-binding response regulator, OmpR family, contains REC and winged-helix (wHTH) domain [Flaviramulus basaltis]|uniref:DNA-binding response regulator, OmpR family, contains REC and winged-helix (WHTH) domain n=1 Tax=Flaviramulus basaltis TaxID=369401 RepID=A0A1K2IC29_9FLAO|nr:response regulator transcription factor [Flaviramulus basaltis]SFZ89945.1 DNA-binding response regulator, OmpR family, contains REC and winged-helix (wHTH) domain [Flaviramulus basaltis]